MNEHEKIIGNQWWRLCADCDKWVRVNKWFFGDLHFCLSDEEAARKVEKEQSR